MPRQLGFVAFGVPIELSVDGYTRAELDAILPPGWAPARDTVPAARFVLRALSDRSGYELVVNGQLERLGPRRDLAIGTLDARIRLFVGEHAPGYVFVHAGVVALGSRALLLPGPSLAGKSTLVAALVRAGGTYFSDEYAVLDHDGRVHPYPRRVSLRPSDHPEGSVEIEPATIGRVADGAPATAALAVLTRYRAGATWRPKQRAPSVALLRLLAHTLPARTRPQESIDTLRRAIAHAPTLESDRGDASTIAEVLLELLAAAP